MQGVGQKEPLANRPKYRQVKEHLLGKVRSGSFAPGALLPTERELAASLKVAVGTLRNALRELEDEGIIRRVRGKGTFVNSPWESQARQRVDLFALMVPQVREGLYPSLIHGFEQAAASVEHQLTVGNSHNEISRQADLIRQAAKTNVAGVAMVPTTYPPTPPAQVQILQEHHIPLVFCHRRIDGVDAPLVTWSGRQVGRLMAEAFLDQGHRRIDNLAAFQDVMFDSIIQGIRQTLVERGLDESSHRIHYYRERLPGTFAREAIREVMKGLFEADDPPTALCCGNLPDAEQVYLLAAELGIKIPDDLSLVYFGGKWRQGPMARHLTCVGVDERQLGLRAAQLIGEIGAGKVPHDSDQRIEIPVELLPGRTVGPPGRR